DRRFKGSLRQQAPGTERQSMRTRPYDRHVHATTGRQSVPPRRGRRDRGTRDDEIMSLLEFVADQVQMMRVVEIARGERAGDLRDLRLEAALDRMDVLVRERPGT